MSNVVQLVTDKKSGGFVAPREGTGRILLFTGVRYVRDEPETGLEAGETVDQPAASPQDVPTERLKA